MTDWQAWHGAYERPGSALSQRLEVVQRFLRRALDDAPGGTVRLLSLCAGQGRDVLGVLADHPRRRDVQAVLVEADPRLVAEARTTAVGLESHVDVIEADAGTTTSFENSPTNDVVLLCGIFGNITDVDVEHTVRNSSRLCSDNATVIWTRHPSPPDLTVDIREWFKDSGFEELGFDNGSGLYGVGANRLSIEPQPFAHGVRLFSFVEG